MCTENAGGGAGKEEGDVEKGHKPWSLVPLDAPGALFRLKVRCSSSPGLGAWEGGEGSSL